MATETSSPETMPAETSSTPRSRRAILAATAGGLAALAAGALAGAFPSVPRTAIRFMSATT